MGMQRQAGSVPKAPCAVTSPATAPDDDAPETGKAKPPAGKSLPKANHKA